MANRREVISEFLELVINQSTRRWSEDFTMKDLLYHLIENGIIPPKTLRNYMMFNDFDTFLIKNQGHVGNTFVDLSIKHLLSEKQCRNIIYKQKYKVSKDYNIKR
jgi:hypothetical protein